MSERMSTAAPSVGRAIPFLPGTSYSNGAQKRYPRSRIFEFKQGAGRSLAMTGMEVDPLERVVTASTSTRLDLEQGRGETAGSKIVGDFAQQEQFVPAFAGLDGKTLRFICDLSEEAPEALNDRFRERSFTIIYYLVDDTMQIVEQRRHNSGYMHGVFMKRHKVPRAFGSSIQQAGQGQGPDFVSLYDFVDTNSVVVYGRVFRLAACNRFTADFFAANGLPLSVQVIDSDDAGEEVLPSPGGANTQPLVEVDTARMAPAKRAGYKRERFLKYNKKVLRFYATWDDRKSMFGDRRFYVLNYYLSDDALEVLERYGKNEGRDPYPKLVSKGRIPRQFFGINPIGVSADDISDRAYISYKDLRVGESVAIYNRQLHLYACDAFTRHFYEHATDMPQPADETVPEELVEFPQQTEPPYIGFGTEEDSIASFYRLVPKPRAFDALKQEELDKIVFRWKAKFDVQKMSQAGPDDSKRRFVVSYYMADNTISIYEPPVSNSGFNGGKFLDRTRVRKHGTSKFECKWMSQDELLVDLPGSVWINNYPFVLLECDRFTLRYRNKGNIAALMSVDTVHAKLAVNISDLNALGFAFMERDPEGSGGVWLDDFVQVLQESVREKLGEDELMALVSHWDRKQEGTVPYRDFIDALAAL